VETALALYREFYTRLCIPVIVSRRPDWDKFPGADYTMAVDTIMPDGKTLQIGTAHHLGDHFSRTFDIRFEDPAGEQRLAFQTCYGISERSIAALISLHGDDRGLVLPPAVAPVQAIIVPITIGKRKDEVNAAAAALEETLRAAGFRVKRDLRDIRPGAKYYYWEMRGVPLRIEIGPRDLDAGQVTAVTRTGEKSAIRMDAVVDGVRAVLDAFQAALLSRAEEHVRARLRRASSVAAVTEIVAEGVALVSWCGHKGCADRIEEETNASILGTGARSPFIRDEPGACVVCGKPGTTALVGRAY
jgi:prolyl-tRNA synthetase